MNGVLSHASVNRARFAVKSYTLAVSIRYYSVRLARRTDLAGSDWRKSVGLGANEPADKSRRRPEGILAAG